MISSVVGYSHHIPKQALLSEEVKKKHVSILKLLQAGSPKKMLTFQELRVMVRGPLNPTFSMTLRQVN